MRHVPRSHRRRSRRLSARVATLASITGTMLFLVAVPAMAHVALSASNPADGSTVAAAPTEIRLDFSTAAQPAGDGIVLYDPTGSPVAASVTTPSDTTVIVVPNATLAPGQYLVSWTMKAGDAHPKSGTVGFSVAPPTPITQPGAETTPDQSATTAAPATDAGAVPPVAFEALIQEPSTAIADWIGRIARIASFSAVLLGLGAFVFAALVFEGSRGEARMVGYWARRAGAVIVLSVPLEIGSQAILLAGGSIGAIFDPALLGQSVEGQFGVALLLRAVGGAALFFGTRMVTSWSGPVDGPDPAPTSDWRTPRGGATTISQPATERFHLIASPIALTGALTLALSFLFDGHTAVTAPSWLVRFATVVHIAAAATWVGGVAMLAAIFNRRRARDEPLDAARLVIPFSTVAAGAVVLTGLAGAVLAFTIVDSFSEFFTTAWGRVLILKLTLVVAAGGIGGYNHEVLVPLLKLHGDEGRAGREISRAVRAEVKILLGVAIATAILVSLGS